MKALRLEGVNQLELIEVDRPVLRDDQLLIRTGGTTICTSDLTDLQHLALSGKTPIVMGHEGAGTVVAVGRAVTGFRVGDRVACHPVHPCRQCPTCRRGLEHLCTELSHFGYNMPGTFAEYFACRQDRARVVPADVAFETAALAEPVCVCLEALERARLKAGDRLLILGDGPFGVMMARLAKSYDLGQLVLAGRHEFRLGFGGTAEKFNMKKHADPVAALRERSGGDGFDAVIVAVATAEAVKQSVELLRARGRMVMFAVMTEPCPVDLFRVMMKELEIVGAVNDVDLFDKAVKLLPEVSDLVTHRFKLVQYREALELAAKGREQAMKVAFVF